MTDSPIIAPWHLTVLEAEARSVDAKLTAARDALLMIVAVIEQTHGVTGKRWSQRDRLRYIQAVCRKALRRLNR